MLFTDTVSNQHQGVMRMATGGDLYIHRVFQAIFAGQGIVSLPDDRVDGGLKLPLALIMFISDMKHPLHFAASLPLPITN